MVYGHTNDRRLSVNVFTNFLRFSCRKSELYFLGEHLLYRVFREELCRHDCLTTSHSLEKVVSSSFDGKVETKIKLIVNFPPFRKIRSDSFSDIEP